MNLNFLYRAAVFATLLAVMVSCSDDEKVQQEQNISDEMSDKTERQEKHSDSSLDKKQQYSVNVVPKKMTVQEKKQRFSSLVAPAVIEVHAELMKQYNQVSQFVENGTDDAFLTALKKEYKVESDHDLLMALKPHPQSIGMAQAAMESGWGTSRFFREANNIFGVWSFDKNEPRIAASQKRENKTIWVKKYPSIKASIKDYYRVLARGNAFQEFRTLKMKTSDPYQLVKKLDRYSEKGDEYGKELAAMIKYNKFYAYDDLH